MDLNRNTWAQEKFVDAGVAQNAPITKETDNALVEALLVKDVPSFY